MGGSPSRPVVLLATWSGMPEGEEWTGTSHLLSAFAEREVDARWAVWDDPDVDWGAGLVAVRSTWDYEWRRGEFLGWARSVPWLLNSAAVFTWNTDKTYLTQLATAGVPLVPTIVAAGEEDLVAALAEISTASDRLNAVVKPTVGAGGRGLVVLDYADGTPVGLGESGLGESGLGESGLGPDLGPGPWVVQPLVESVRTEGEISVFVLDGRVVSQARKLPATGEIRVHEQYGGTTVAVEVTDEAADLARRTVRAAEAILGERLDYARVDQMRLVDGTLAISELEVTEPGLYLEVLPGNAAAFADLVLSRLHSH